MPRFLSNEKKTFSEILQSSARETNDILSQRRKVMDQAWDDVDEGWQTLQEHMTEVGITKPLDSKEGMVMLNVGGSRLTFRRSVLEGNAIQQASTRALGNLCEAEWDKRVPRDSDGRIVLDESPTCVKHLVHALLPCPASAKGMVAREEHDVVSHQKPNLLYYTARVLGLSGHFAPGAMSIRGGITILEPHEASELMAIVQRWCPGHPDGLERLYCAARDGWSGAAFYRKCGDESPWTITFMRVKGRKTGGTDSIIGGFSSVPWTSPGGSNCYTASPWAFLFMLKDGEESGSGSAPFQPMKWGIKDGHATDAVYRGHGCGPFFGAGGNDLGVVWTGPASTVHTKNDTYEVPAGSRFLSLNGCTVVDIETFRVCIEPIDTLSSTEQEYHSVGDIAVPPAPVRTTDDALTFGHLIADSLMEEEMVLQEARNELALATARTTACAAALAAVYGPDVAKGREEDVVELSVRGTRVTTMRSTLRICPDSTFATRFDEDQWPAAEKDLDDNGRRVIDCKPSVFSKVMDILRLAKRASWARGDDDEEANETPRVTIKTCDRVEFEEFVDMYFKGCESFIMEYVESLGDKEDR